MISSVENADQYRMRINCVHWFAEIHHPSGLFIGMWLGWRYTIFAMETLFTSTMSLIGTLNLNSWVYIAWCLAASNAGEPITLIHMQPWSRWTSSTGLWAFHSSLPIIPRKPIMRPLLGLRCRDSQLGPMPIAQSWVSLFAYSLIYNLHNIYNMKLNW